MTKGHDQQCARRRDRAGRCLRRRMCAVVAVWVAAAAGSLRVPAAHAAGDNSATEQPLTSAEAAKHSVLAHPAFWLIPETQGCVATTTRGLGAPPVAAAVAWDTNVWVCTFTKEFGVARCQNLNRVDVKTRKTVAFNDGTFMVRPDRNPSWAATFGGLTDAFVSDHETLATNARREYLLQTDTFKRDPASTIHTVCTGRWDPISPKDAADLARKPNAAPPPLPSPSVR